MPLRLVSQVFPNTPLVNWNNTVSPSVSRNLPTLPRPWIGNERGPALAFITPSLLLDDYKPGLVRISALWLDSCLQNIRN